MRKIQDVGTREFLIEVLIPDSSETDWEPIQPMAGNLTNGMPQSRGYVRPEDSDPSIVVDRNQNHVETYGRRPKLGFLVDDGSCRQGKVCPARCAKDRHVFDRRAIPDSKSSSNRRKAQSKRVIHSQSSGLEIRVSVPELLKSMQ